MEARRFIPRFVAAAVTVTVLVAVAVVATNVALLLAPAVLLFVVLLLGVFPGERVLDRVRERRLTRPKRRRSLVMAPVLELLVRPAGRSLSFALAMRPPPALVRL